MKRLAIALALVACSSTPKPQLASLQVTAPGNATAGTPFAVKISAFDANKAPIEIEGVVQIVDGATPVAEVTFAAADKGVQSAQVTLDTAGDHALAAVNGSVQAPFHVFVQAGAAASLQLVSGDAQQGTAGTALGAFLAVKVTDGFGNPVPGENVSWKVLSGAGSVSPAVTASGSDGVAMTAATLDKLAGPNQFQATWGSVNVSFSATGKPGAAAKLVVTSGNNQRGVTSTALALPFKVRATDPFGNLVPAPTLTWTANLSGDSVTAGAPDAEGNATATATLGATGGPRSFTASLSPSITASFEATTFQLVYVAPAAGGKVRLVANAASTPDVAVLDVVTNTALTAFSAGMNLPLDATRVVADATPLVPGTALPAGTAPVAARAALLPAGPLKGVLVSVQTQKASGSGAVATDTALPSGALLYTLRVHIKGTATAGTVFDGAALPAGFRAAVRTRAGTDVASSADFAIGKLTVGP